LTARLSAGHYSRSGGSVNVTGTLDNSGNTLDVGNAGPFGSGGLGTLSGTIRNGTVLSTHATPTLTASNGTLDGVTLGGTALTTSGNFIIANGIRLSDGMTVNKGNGNWSFTTSGLQHIATTGAGTATLNNAGGTIYAGYNAAGQTLQIDSGITLQGYGALTQSTHAAVIDNAGTLAANSAGQTFTISPARFTNTGTLTVGGGTLTIAPTDAAAPNWSNAGTLAVDAGVLNLGGTFAVADLAASRFSRSAGSTVNLTGMLDNSGNALDLGSGGLFGAAGLGALSGTIRNGSLVGTLDVLSGSATLDGISIAGSVNVGGSGTLNLNNAWTLPGSLSLAGGTLSLGGTYTLAHLVANLAAGGYARSGGSVNLGGTLDNTGRTLDIGSSGPFGSYGPFGSGGLATANYTVSNGTVISSSATPAAKFSGKLDGVTLGGSRLTFGTNLTISNGITLADGLTVDKGNTNWSVASTGGTHIATPGTATIISGGGYINVGTNAAGLSFQIDSGITLRGYGDLVSSTTPIVNAGTLIADTAGGTFTVRPGSFTNSGTLAVDGGTLAIAPTGATTPNWSNSGTLRVDAGTLNLGGKFTTAGLGSVVRSGGTLQLLGTLDNTGATLDIGSAGAFGKGGLNGYSNGTIAGGTLQSSDATPLQFYYGTLDGVTLGGSALSTGGQINIRNGITLADGVTVDMGSSSWLFIGSGTQAIATTGTARLDNAGGALYAWTSGQTLQIDGGVTVQGYGTLGGTTATTLANYGTLNANVAGQELTLNPETFINSGGSANANGGTLNIAPVEGWINSGSINANSGTLKLGGNFTAAALDSAHYHRSAGSTVILTGTLDNANATLDIGSAGLFGSGGLGNAGGTIKAGTIVSTDGTALMSEGATLDGVTLGGGALATRGNLTISNGITLADGVTVDKGDGTWSFNSTGIQHIATTGSATLYSAGGGLVAGAGVDAQTLQVDSGVTMQGSGSLSQDMAAALINVGTLNGNFTTRFDAITNHGTLAGIGNVTVGDGSGTLINNGTIAPGIAGGDASGTLNLYGNLAMAAGSRLDIAISSPLASDYGVLNVSGSADLSGGSLRLSGGGGAGTYGVLNAASLGGTNFAAIDAGGFTQTPTYADTGLSLAVGANSNAVLTWVNGTGGDWSNPANWSSGVVPSAADSPYIGSGAGTVHVTTDQAAHAVTVDGNLVLSAGSLNLAGASVLRGTTSLGGGTLTGTGAITIAGGGTLEWTAGSIDATAAATLTTQRGATANVGGGTLGANRTWNNSGTLNLSPATWNNNGRLNHLAGNLYLNGAFTAAALNAKLAAGHYSRSGGAVGLEGTLDNSGNTLDIGGAGVFGAGGLTTFNGSIINGTVISGDATALRQRPNGGVPTLDGVTLGGGTLNTRGSFALVNDLTLADGVTVSIGDGTWRFNTSGQHVATAGTATLTSAYGNWYTDGALTIDSGVTLQGYGYLGQECWCNLTASIVNAGSIVGNTSGQTLTISAASFSNSGTTRVAAGAMDLYAPTVANSGSLSVAAGTLSVNHGDSAASFSNSGSLNISGGTLNLGGSMTTAGLGGIVRSGGSLYVTGLLDNTGSTLDIGSGGIFGAGGLTGLGSTTYGGGAIKNGTVRSGDGTVLNAYVATLDGVTLGGTTLKLAGGFNIYNHLTLAGGTTVNLGNGSLGFAGAGLQHIASAGTATLNLAGGAIYAGDASQSLQIDSGVTLQGYGQLGGGNGTDTLINAGTIDANAPGRTLTINSALFTNDGTLDVSGGALSFYSYYPVTWTNPGTLNLNSGKLVLSGNFTLADLAAGHYSRQTGTTVNLYGTTLDNSGNTLDLGSAGLFGSGGLNAFSGTLRNGTVLNTDATPTLTSSSATLDGVTLGSNLALNGTLNIDNALTLADGVTLTKDNATWYFRSGGTQHIATTGTATLNNLGGILNGVGQTLQIDSGVTLQGYGTLINYLAIDNRGTIAANTAGQSFTIASSLANTGTLKATAGTLTVTNAFTQSGTIDVAGGATFTRSTGFTNTGTLSGSGTIVVGTGASKLVNLGHISPGGSGATGTLSISGDVQLWAGSTLDIDLAGTGSSQYDKLAISGVLSGNGASFGNLKLAKTNGYTYVDVDGDSFPLLSAASGAASASFDSFRLARTHLSSAYAGSGLTVTAAPMVLTVNADALSKNYGTDDPVLTYSASGFDATTTDTAASALSGFLSRAAGNNVGTYGVNRGTLASPLGYAISLTPGIDFTINPSRLSIISLAGTRAYDGTVYVDHSIFALSGLAPNEDLTLTGVGTMADKNVGVDKPVSLGSLALGNGSTGLASNYTFDGGSFKATITAKALTASYTGSSKVYDRTTSATVTGSSADIISGDTVSFSQSAAFADKNAGTATTINVAGIALGGSDAANYALQNTTATT
ncbi:MAG: hypothetical protein HZC24_12350, partial [Rhodocyclales bacterium]|nr:hypothetical protein [Rhodocyclales bacterium]